jgi:hypothetical protein
LTPPSVRGSKAVVTFGRKGGDWKSGKGFFMKEKARVIEFPLEHRKGRSKKKRDPLNVGKKGRV